MRGVRWVLLFGCIGGIAVVVLTTPMNAHQWWQVAFMLSVVSIYLVIHGRPHR